jgi:prepilin-type N-terminal cleavage/methylation domain-containing protein
MRIHLAFGIRHLELRRGPSLRRGFTLIELLVVIGIIALLASILFPVIGKVRESARETDTKALIASIEAACQTYHQDYRAYPGPLSNAYVTAEDQVAMPPSTIQTGWRGSDTGIGLAASGSTAAVPAGFNDAKVANDGTVDDGSRVTAAENLVLGLLGGISVNKQNQFYLEFSPDAVGTGAALLNPVRAGRAGTYMQSSSLSKGKFVDDNGLNFVTSKDSVIPEFVDRFAQPMPILVMRARIGGRGVSTASYDDKNNDVVVNIPFSGMANTGWENGQYNLVDITPYTQSQVGSPRNLKQTAYVPAFDSTKPHGLIGEANMAASTPLDPKVQYPYIDPLHYLADPNTIADPSEANPQTRLKKMKARKADQIILISAGRDRVYGTDDDVTNFGSVRP